VYGARFSTGFPTRGYHWIPLLVALEASMRATNSMPPGYSLYLTGHTVCYVTTLKAFGGSK
jgi:hypothetical protein